MKMEDKNLYANISIDEYNQELKKYVDIIEKKVKTSQKEAESEAEAKDQEIKTDDVSSYFDAFHSIKSLAGIMDLKTVYKIADKTEALIDEYLNGTKNQSIVFVDIINSSLKYLKQEIERLEESKSIDSYLMFEKHLEYLNDIKVKDNKDCAECYKMYRNCFENLKLSENNVSNLKIKLLAMEQNMIGMLHELENANIALQQQMEKIKNQEKSLRHADKMASLGLLVAGIAHEINNPTTFIRSNLELMKRYWDKIKKEIIDNIDAERIKNSDVLLDEIISDFESTIKDTYDGTERIIKIVNGLKTFASNDTEEFSTIDIFDAVESAHMLIKNQLIACNIKFDNKIEKDRYYIRGSLQKLSQLFVNIFYNSARAIKYFRCSDRDGLIEVYIDEVTDGYISVFVKDNGCGIKKEHLPKLFDPFFSTYKGQGGTGLGLSIVYGIISEHKGQIYVETEEGKGAIFRFDIPK